MWYNFLWGQTWPNKSEPFVSCCLFAASSPYLIWCFLSLKCSTCRIMDPASAPPQGSSTGLSHLGRQDAGSWLALTPLLPGEGVALRHHSGGEKVQSEVWDSQSRFGVLRPVRRPGHLVLKLLDTQVLRGAIYQRLDGISISKGLLYDSPQQVAGSDEKRQSMALRHVLSW